MIPYIDSHQAFPSIQTALTEPNGLLVAGADLSIERLTEAYSKGIFPWFSQGEPILWWTPDPRTVFNLAQYQPSRSLKRFIKKGNFSVTLNRDFETVIENCSLPRGDQDGTWINQEMKLAYLKLFQQKLAHSVEVWQDGNLIGGIYGVAIGKLFCGESMFSKISNGSKVALAFLIEYLKSQQFPIIDCQVENPHLISLGAQKIERDEYMTIVKNVRSKTVACGFWEPQTLNVNFTR